MSLTHVCMWSEHGWVHISAERAAQLHPGGTVSARSGLFMCELCGQYVTLTDGEHQVRHFRHNAHEEGLCPERTIGPAYTIRRNPEEHELPIRIKIISDSCFELEVGLLYLPQNVLSRFKNEKIEIIPEGQHEQKFVYSISRLNDNMITYLSIGNIPFLSYKVEIPRDLKRFWQERIRGISRCGTIFDGRTGRMMTEDADIQLGKEYYLLCADQPELSCDGVRFEKICMRKSNWSTWYLYKTCSFALTEAAARFFLHIHYRLTDTPMTMQPIWPVYVQTPYVIKHHEEALMMYVNGQSEIITNVFPPTSVRKLQLFGKTKVVKIICNGRQQLISAGRAKVLQYTYFWKEELNAETACPQLIVTDYKGQEVQQGIHAQLPPNKLLSFTPAYDGYVLIKKKDQIRDKRPIKSGASIEIDGLQFEDTVQIYCGLDLIWQAAFQKHYDVEDGEDRNLAKKLRDMKGAAVWIDHSLGSLATELYDYPETKQWLYEAIRQGKMSRKALVYLKTWIFQKKGRR